MSKIQVLDLHGLTHSEAKIKVEDFILHKSLYTPCSFHIITGNSDKMAKVVFEVLDRYNQNDIRYYVPSDNLGMVVVHMI